MNSTEIQVLLDPEAVAVLRGLLGRLVWSIGAQQLMLEKHYIWGDVLCLFTEAEKLQGIWDPVQSFVTFRQHDHDDSVVPGRVVTLLEISQGIAASEIPFENGAPGPYSSICGDVRWLRIADITTIFCSFAATGIGKSFAEAAAESEIVTIEAGVRFTGTDGRSFMILAEQTGDLHYLRPPEIAELLGKGEHETSMIVREGRKIEVAG